MLILTGHPGTFTDMAKAKAAFNKAVRVAVFDGTEIVQLKRETEHGWEIICAFSRKA